ncbi:MAG: E2/UBC family protein [Acidimicrobiales bacterium]
MTLVDVLDNHLASVKARHPKAELVQMPDGQRLLVVPDVSVRSGWTKPSVTVRVLVPVGFPHVKPDCFYTDADLRVAPTQEPKASSVQAVFGAQYRWFSWHLQDWSPVNGTLDQYVRFCERRFHEVQ